MGSSSSAAGPDGPTAELLLTLLTPHFVNARYCCCLKKSEEYSELRE